MLHQHRLQASRPLRNREEAGVQLLHQGCAPRQVSQHRLWSSIAVIGSHGVEDKRRVVIVSASPAPASSQAGQVPTPRAPKKKSKKLVDINGDVSKDLGNGMFQIKLENGVTVLAHLSGKIRQNRIKIVTGDKVTVELSPYDLTKGRLTYRFRPGEYDRLQQEAAQAQNAAASS